MASLVTDMQELDVEHINNKYNQNQKVVASVDNNTKIENVVVKKTNNNNNNNTIQNVVIMKENNNNSNNNIKNISLSNNLNDHKLTIASDWKKIISNTYMEIKIVKFHPSPTDEFQLHLKLLPHFIVNEINKFLTGTGGFRKCHLDFQMSEDVSGRTNLGPSYLKSVKVKNYLHMVGDAYYNENNKFNKYALWYHHSEMGMSIMTLDAAAYILERFCNFLETINKLDLKWKHINDSMTVAMSNALRINVSLISLDFSRNEIRQRGAIALADALKENRSLQILKLNDNSINDIACNVFSEMLLVNSTLLELDLGGNRISDHGINVLLNSMYINDTLSILNVASNKGITEEWKLNFLKEEEDKKKKMLLPKEEEGGGETLSSSDRYYDNVMLMDRVIISNYDLATSYDPR